MHQDTTRRSLPQPGLRRGAHDRPLWTRLSGEQHTFIVGSRVWGWLLYDDYFIPAWL